MNIYFSKNIVVIFIVSLVSVFLLSCDFCTDSKSQIVHFNDDNFENIIRGILDKPDGDITENEMLSVEIISGNYIGISDITGIEYCKNVKIVDLNYNSINDLGPLSDLNQIWFLSLKHNNIENIGPLSNLRNIKELVINDNQISDLSVVKEMPLLLNLFLQNNKISDISPIVNNSGLDNGDMVELRNNPLNSISIHTYIPRLQNRGVVVHYTQSNPQNDGPAIYN